MRLRRRGEAPFDLTRLASEFFLSCSVVVCDGPCRAMSDARGARLVDGVGNAACQFAVQTETAPSALESDESVDGPDRVRERVSEIAPDVGRAPGADVA